MTHKKSIIITIFVAFIWSLSGLFVKKIDWNPLAIAGGRSAIAVLLMLPYMARTKVKVSWYVLGGAVCYCLFNYCFTISTKLTTAAMAIMMQYTAPIYVVLLSWVVFKEKIKKGDAISIVFVIIGMVLFFSDQFGGGTMVGNLIAVCNGLTFAGISIFLRLQKNENPVLSMFFGNLISAIVGIPFMLTKPTPSTLGLSLVAINGACVALTYCLYAYASKGLTSLESVLIPILDPLLNPVWVMLLAGEYPGLTSIIGSVIILTSVTLNVLFEIHQESISERDREKCLTEDITHTSKQ